MKIFSLPYFPSLLRRLRFQVTIRCCGKRAKQIFMDAKKENSAKCINACINLPWSGPASKNNSSAREMIFYAKRGTLSRGDVEPFVCSRIVLRKTEGHYHDYFFLPDIASLSFNSQRMFIEKGLRRSKWVRMAVFEIFDGRFLLKLKCCWIEVRWLKKIRFDGVCLMNYFNIKASYVAEVFFVL